MPGPVIRSDIVDVYAFRRGTIATDLSDSFEFLQLRRVSGTLPSTWQPVMGHVENGETAADAAVRELAEETGISPNHGLVNLWQLESVNIYFLAPDDVIMMSPGFAAEVSPNTDLALDETHNAARWIQLSQIDQQFLWPGQRRAIVEIQRVLLPHESAAKTFLQIDLSTVSSRKRRDS